MQIDEKEEITEQLITYEDSIVNVDYALSKLRHYQGNQGRDYINSNPWPEVSYCFRERSVIFNQLWLHRIQYYTESETAIQIEQATRHQSNNSTNQQIITYYDSDLLLTCICNTSIHWNNNSVIQYQELQVIDYIQYLKPLVLITGQSIIATIVARAINSTQHLFNSEIVSIGEFRPFYNNQSNHWQYIKETKELSRNHNFKFFHQYDLYKSVNYQVRQRIVITLNQFVHLEIILVKQSYFEEIIQYYSHYNQYSINTSSPTTFNCDQPHQIDRFDSIEHIVTEYYTQS